MSRNMKLFLGCGCLLVVMCACACIAVFVGGPMMLASAFSSDTAKARQVGAQIADYKLPAGLSEQLSMDLVVVKMVVIARLDSSGPTPPMYMMMQAQGMDRDQIEQQMKQAIQQQLQNNADIQFTQVGTQQVTIKGKPSTMTIYEGRSNDAGLVRQAVVSFEGKGGTVVLMILDSTATWNQAEINGFLGSIR
ncbi:MAG: hypothetical protein HZB53_13410 [Chloroflexi bacterium]|nr:hypothetical protein [Chloroflexota bacterium]